MSRTSHKAKPTQACDNILVRAKKIISEAKGFANDIDNTSLSGPFNIGAISPALTSMIPNALKQLTKQAPNAKLSIIPGTSASLFEALKNEEIDAAIIVKPPFPIAKHISYEKLTKEPLILLSSKPIEQPINHELLAQPYIQYDNKSWGGQLAKRYLSAHHLTIEPLCNLDSLEAISLLAAQGLGVSLVPKWPDVFNIARQYQQLYAQEIIAAEYQRELVLAHAYYPNRANLVKNLSKILTAQLDQ